MTRPRRPARIVRAVPLDDIEISRSGDGRTVTAYATPFDTQTEVRDHHGHYFEMVRSTAFDKSLAESIDRVQVFYNHGFDVHGRPSDRYSMPIGTPVEIRPDGKGLLTVTRYAKTDLADEVLELIRSGAIRAQSFTARIYRSREVGRSGRLPIIERVELGLREYGPTPMPVAAGADILAVRSLTDLAADIDELDADQRAELIAILSDTDPDAPAPPDEEPPVDGPPSNPDTPDDDLDPEDDPAPSDSDHERDLLMLANQARRRRARA